VHEVSEVEDRSYSKNTNLCCADDAQSSALLMEQVTTLRDTMLRQCDELRVLRREVDEKNSEVDAVCT